MLTIKKLTKNIKNCLTNVKCHAIVPLSNNKWEDTVMELTKVQEKIKKESLTAFIIVVIFGGLSAIMASVFLLFVIATGISPGVNHPSPETALIDILVSTAPWILNGFTVGIISLLSAKLLYRIHINYTPFSEKNTKSLNAIAIVAPIMGFVFVLFDIFTNLVMEFNIGLTTFVLIYALMGLVFGLFARIFEYGRLLQQESDEIL